MPAYYNEHDPQKAAWLRELIAQKVIAAGDVDERSVHDVRADDLRGYEQCHFFAGIGVWSYAFRLAGWEDDRPAWTGSCPCPSFSAAGKGEGFDDPRHLWPVWMPLIGESRPPVVFGEQADAAIGHGWLDLVSTDLEAENYAVASAVLGAASVGAPHRRQRLYFVGDAQGGNREVSVLGRRPHQARVESGRASAIGILGDTDQQGPQRPSAVRCGSDQRATRSRSLAGGMADATEQRHVGRRAGGAMLQPGAVQEPERLRDAGVESERSSPLNGFWRDADWIFCRDGKWRPVRPGSFPLVTGAPARILRLRGYGDGLCAETAAEFVRAYMEMNR